MGSLNRGNFTLLGGNTGIYIVFEDVSINLRLLEVRALYRNATECWTIGFLSEVFAYLRLYEDVSCVPGGLNILLFYTEYNICCIKQI
jgi:hypothetical protein